MRARIGKALVQLGRLAVRICIALFFGAVGLYALEFLGLLHWRTGARKVILAWEEGRGRAAPPGGSLVPVGASDLLPAAGGESAKEDRTPAGGGARFEKDGESATPAQAGRTQVKRREFVRAKNFVAYDNQGFGTKMREHQDMPTGILRKFDGIPLEQRPAQRRSSQASPRSRKTAASPAAQGAGARREEGSGRGKKTPVQGSSAPDLVVRQGRFFDDGEVTRWQKGEEERLRREEFWKKLNRRMFIGFVISVAALFVGFFLSGMFKALLKMLREPEGTFRDFDFRPIRKSSWKEPRK